MIHTCRHCSAQFEITKDDLNFYEKISPAFGGKKELITPPMLCPDCRQQRRFSWRNERKLYHRKSDRSGKQIISIYTPDNGLTVYDQQEWWSDEWDGLTYGMEIDFSKPFFGQFAALQKQVPRLSIFNQNCENSEYTNQSYDNKNCYLCSAIGDSEDLLYVQNATHLKDAVDTSYSQQGELLYDCIDTYDSYRCIGVQQSVQCSDSAFLYDCIGCRNCFWCVGLRQKEYCILNKQHTKQEYERNAREIMLDSHSHLAQYRKNFDSFCRKFPRVAAWIKNSENAVGNNIRNSKNVHNCFDIFDVEDAKHTTWVFRSRDVYDAYGMGKSQRICECIGVENVYDVHFSSVTSDSRDCFYTDLCFSSNHLFGCIGLRNKEYCILNKQYTKEEYERLAPKLIAHMRKTGEWGEFFPVTHSPFAYNESIANDSHPLTKQQAAANGWRWHEKMESSDLYLGPPVHVPDRIEDVTDVITEQILLCAQTGKPYKIIPKELSFYREIGLPIPCVSPDVRYADRMALRNPRKLWSRKCAQCQKAIQTTYAPDRPEIVYCEQCYVTVTY